jgi:hypothetical protein
MSFCFGFSWISYQMEIVFACYPKNTLLKEEDDTD